MRRGHACNWGMGGGHAPLYPYCCLCPRFVPKPCISGYHIPSAYYYLAGGLGGPKGPNYNVSPHQVYKTELLQTWHSKAGHNRQLASGYDLRVQKGLPVSKDLPSSSAPSFLHELSSHLKEIHAFLLNLEHIVIWERSCKRTHTLAPLHVINYTIITLGPLEET